jgi:hypothetical protein
MSYIYDVLLNWVSNYSGYDFYEWDMDDDIENVKKTPILKLDKFDFKRIYYNEIIVDANILKMLYRKTEVIDDKSISYIEYSCIFTDGDKAMAIEFDNKGFSMFKSLMLLDEECEVLDIANKLEVTEVGYKILKKDMVKLYLTRSEQKNRDFLCAEFNKINRNKNIDKLKYIYYEWYNKSSDDFNYMYDKIKKILAIEWNKKHDNIYNLLMLSNMKKQL